MPKIKAAFLLCVVLALTVFLSGCIDLDFQNGELIHAPKADAEHSAVQAVIDDVTGGNYILKFPQSGEYKTAIIFKDMNNDGQSEAVCFYSPNDPAAAAVNVLIIEQKDSNWQKAGVFTATATELNRVLFADINGDGTAEIIAGYGALPQSISKLAVYGFTANGTTEFTLPNTDNIKNFEVAAFTGEKHSDIITLSVSATGEGYARLISWRSDTSSLGVLAQTPLQSGIATFEQILCCELGTNTKGIIADAKTSDGSYITQVLYFDYDENTFKNTLATNNTTLRSNPIFSMDTDGNGSYEIPVCTTFGFAENEDKTKVGFLTAYCNYDINTDQLTPVLSGVADATGAYFLNLPAKWNAQNVTMRINSNENTLLFYEWSTAQRGNANTTANQPAATTPAGLQTTPSGKLLLKIRTFAPQEWATTAADGYLQLAKNNSCIIGYSLPDTKSPLAVTEADLSGMFLDNK
ncbi:MAG: VCBS repeat-containing protein [Oscillospiraceae bacterium]|nr:VCBS repeat-containing protein [Oscillospiraceae bacterium]